MYRRTEEIKSKKRVGRNLKGSRRWSWTGAREKRGREKKQIPVVSKQDETTQDT